MKSFPLFTYEIGVPVAGYGRNITENSLIPLLSGELVDRVEEIRDYMEARDPGMTDVAIRIISRGIPDPPFTGEPMAVTAEFIYSDGWIRVRRTSISIHDDMVVEKEDGE